MRTTVLGLKRPNIWNPGVYTQQQAAMTGQVRSPGATPKSLSSNYAARQSPKPRSNFENFMDSLKEAKSPKGAGAGTCLLLVRLKQAIGIIVCDVCHVLHFDVLHYRSHGYP